MPEWENNVCSNKIKQMMCFFFLLPFGCKTCIFTNAYMCGLTVARTNVFKNNRTHTDAQSCAYRIYTPSKNQTKKINRQFSIQFVMHKSKRYGCGRSHSLSFRPICNIWAMACALLVYFGHRMNARLRSWLIGKS